MSQIHVRKKKRIQNAEAKKFKFLFRDFFFSLAIFEGNNLKDRLHFFFQKIIVVLMFQLTLVGSV